MGSRDHVGGGGVHVDAAPERQAFVRRLPHDVVGEGVGAVVVALEELTQLVDVSIAGRHPVEPRHHRVEHAGVEVHAEHRGGTQQVLVRGGQPVDPRGDDRLDRVRDRLARQE